MTLAPSCFSCQQQIPQGKPKGKFFIPVAGFVVKASLERPWAPPPSAPSGADADGGYSGGRRVAENAPAGTKVFINLCGHEGVAPPIDQARTESTRGRPKHRLLTLCLLCASLPRDVSFLCYIHFGKRWRGIFIKKKGGFLGLSLREHPPAVSDPRPTLTRSNKRMQRV